MSFINNNDDWFVVRDFDGFVNQTRILVFNTYGKFDTENDTKHIDSLLNISDKDKEELNEILSYSESVSIIKSIIKRQKNKKTKKNRYILNDALYIKIVENLADRITSNLLQNLVKKGLVETGFDNDSNDFVFWVKEK